MIAYVDTSVIMRRLLGQPNALAEFARVDRPIASKLLKVEGLRTLDRLRTGGFLSEAEFVRASEELRDSIDAVEWIEITDAILDRVCGNFAIALGTLDAIHLSSAMLWREQTKLDIHFLTHDETLGRAARSLGFQILGCLEK
ncbi:MAG: type II toxin-antitoxin system VapC family toxin [Deltaproteobacteria bacterium]|nr:type II toxin-antitoxin system VapC family toxin [Deltaproteobacteria bacterium]